MYISNIKESLTYEVIIHFCDTGQRFHMSTKRTITRLVFLSINRYHFFMGKVSFTVVKRRTCVRIEGKIYSRCLFTVTYSNYFCLIYLFTSNYHFHLLVLLTHLLILFFLIFFCSNGATLREYNFIRILFYCVLKFSL